MGIFNKKKGEGFGDNLPKSVPDISSEKAQDFASLLEQITDKDLFTETQEKEAEPKETIFIQPSKEARSEPLELSQNNEEEIYTAGVKSIALSSGEDEENNNLSDDEKKEIYTLLFRFGYLSEKQIREEIFPAKTELKLPDTLDSIFFQGERIFSHSDKSLRELCTLIGESYRELKKSAFLKDKAEKKELREIILEIDIRLVFKRACEKKKQCQIYGCISAHNPRNKQSIKIQKEKRGSLKPNFLKILLNNGEKWCLIFHILPSYSAFIIGERIAKYRELIWDYNSFLSFPESIQKWQEKVKIQVPENNMGLALVFPPGSEDIMLDLITDMETKNISTPIFLATMENVLKKPFFCWYSNFKEKHILKIKS